MRRLGQGDGFFLLKKTFHQDNPKSSMRKCAFLECTLTWNESLIYIPGPLRGNVIFAFCEYKLKQFRWILNSKLSTVIKLLRWKFPARYCNRRDIRAGAAAFMTRATWSTRPFLFINLIYASGSKPYMEPLISSWENSICSE